VGVMVLLSEVKHIKVRAIRRSQNIASTSGRLNMSTLSAKIKHIPNSHDTTGINIHPDILDRKTVAQKCKGENQWELCFCQCGDYVYYWSHFYKFLPRGVFLGISY